MSLRRRVRRIVALLETIAELNVIKKVNEGITNKSLSGRTLTSKVLTL